MCQARETFSGESSAGNVLRDAKRGKYVPVVKRGKIAASVKRGKVATSAKRRILCNLCEATVNALSYGTGVLKNFTTDWLKTRKIILKY